MPPPDEPPSPGGADDLIGQLTRWMAEERVDAAAAARARERWLVQQGGEEGTFAGVVLDLAERARPVLVHTTGGRRHRGRVRAVAADFLALSTDAGTDLLVAYDAVVSIRPHAGARPVTGDRTLPLDTTLAETLGGLAGERPRVLVVAPSGEPLAGELRAVGRDVITLLLDGPERATVYLRLASVAEVTLLG